MRWCALFTLLWACGDEARRPATLNPSDDDPELTDNTGEPAETAPIPVDQVPVPGFIAEHTCTGTEIYWHDWGLPPQDFTAPPRYGTWRYEAALEQMRWSTFEGLEPDGRLLSFCPCEANGCRTERIVLVGPLY